MKIHPSLAARKRVRCAYRCVIFDLDGTLLDTRQGMLDALSRLLDELGQPPVGSERFADAMHFGLPAMLACALDGSHWWSDAAQRPLLEARLTQAYLQGSAQHVSVFRDARTVLDRLQAEGVWMAICTNQAEHSARHLLATFGLDGYFRAVVGGDTFACRKPDPTPLLWLMRQAGAEPGHALMVGDSEVDVRCAQRAGIDVVVMAHGYGHFDAQPAAPRAADFLALQSILFGTVA